jgi:hypothetical protein
MNGATVVKSSRFSNASTAALKLVRAGRTWPGLRDFLWIDIGVSWVKMNVITS